MKKLTKIKRIYLENSHYFFRSIVLILLVLSAFWAKRAADYAYEAREFAYLSYEEGLRANKYASEAADYAREAAFEISDTRDILEDGIADIEWQLNW